MNTIILLISIFFQYSFRLLFWLNTSCNLLNFPLRNTDILACYFERYDFAVAVDRCMRKWLKINMYYWTTVNKHNDIVAGYSTRDDVSIITLCKCWWYWLVHEEPSKPLGYICMSLSDVRIIQSPSFFLAHFHGLDIWTNVDGWCMQASRTSILYKCLVAIPITKKLLSLVYDIRAK